MDKFHAAQLSSLHATCSSDSANYKAGKAGRQLDFLCTTKLGHQGGLWLMSSVGLEPVLQETCVSKPPQMGPTQQPTCPCPIHYPTRGGTLSEAHLETCVRSPMAVTPDTHEQPTRVHQT